MPLRLLHTRQRFACLSLLLFLTGCGSAPASQPASAPVAPTPQNPVPSPVQSPSATPASSPAPAAAKDGLCAADLDDGALVACLKTYLAGKAIADVAVTYGLPPYGQLKIDAKPVADGLLLISGAASRHPILAWKTEAEWHVAVSALRGDRTYDIERATLVDGRPYVQFSGNCECSGHTVSVFLGRVTADERFEVGRVDDEYGEGDVELLGADWVLASQPYVRLMDSPKEGRFERDYRRRQALWQWQGGKLEPVSGRWTPDPLGALEEFLLRVPTGKVPGVDPALIQRAGDLLGAAPTAWEVELGDATSSVSQRLQQIRTAEGRQWDALPEPFRQALPAELKRWAVTVRLGDRRVEVTLARQEAQWTVVDLAER